MLNLGAQQVLEKHPSVLFDLIDIEFGDDDWIGWEVDSFSRHMPEGLDQLAMDKMLAVKSVAFDLRSATEHAIAFEKIVNAFNNQPCLMDALQPAYIEEVFYAVDQIKKIAEKTHEEDDIEDFVFGGQVPGYVAAAGKYHDWNVLPKPLAFAQSLLDHLTGIKWRRKKDKKIDTAIDALLNLAEQLDSLNDLSVDSMKLMLDGFDTSRFEYRDAARLVGCYLYLPKESVLS